MRSKTFCRGIYKDKDYAGESTFVLACLNQCGCYPVTLLDLGCGTGRHALEFARKGVDVTGVDMSATMLEIGKNELQSAAANSSFFSLPSLHLGDVRSIRLGHKFDSAISLFHVMSYQTKESDALAQFETAKAHLNPGGVFFFDFWYGPGVLSDPPVMRELTMEDESTMIRRKAVPVHRSIDNVVEVHYQIHLADKASGTQSELREVHTMRYWFLPELRYLAKQAGFSVVSEGGWLRDAEPDLSTWNAWMAVQI
jgi:SAM-dependent methyltransferase